MEQTASVNSNNVVLNRSEHSQNSNSNSNSNHSNNNNNNNSNNNNNNIVNGDDNEGRRLSSSSGNSSIQKAVSELLMEKMEALEKRYNSPPRSLESSSSTGSPNRRRTQPQNDNASNSSTLSASRNSFTARLQEISSSRNNNNNSNNNNNVPSSTANREGGLPLSILIPSSTLEWEMVSFTSKHSANVPTRRQLAGVVDLPDHAGHTICVLGGWDPRKKVLDTMEQYVLSTPQNNKHAGTVTLGPSMLQPRCGFGVTTVCLDRNDWYVLVCGGKDADHRFLDTIDFYRVNTQRWHRSSCRLRTPRFGCAAMIHNHNQLLVMGGQNQKHQYLSSIEAIPVDDALTPHQPKARKTKQQQQAASSPFPEMTAPRAFFGVAVVNNGQEIYAMGGCNNLHPSYAHRQDDDAAHQDLDSVEVWSDQTQAWAVKPSMPSRRSKFVAVAVPIMMSRHRQSTQHPSLIAVLGGSCQPQQQQQHHHHNQATRTRKQYLNTVHIYDPYAETWNTSCLPSMATRREGCGAIVMANHDDDDKTGFHPYLYATGGASGFFNFLNSMERLSMRGIENILEESNNSSNNKKKREATDQMSAATTQDLSSTGSPTVPTESQARTRHEQVIVLVDDDVEEEQPNTSQGSDNMKENASPSVSKSNADEGSWKSRDKSENDVTVVDDDDEVGSPQRVLHPADNVYEQADLRPAFIFSIFNVQGALDLVSTEQPAIKEPEFHPTSPAMELMNELIPDQHPVDEYEEEDDEEEENDYEKLPSWWLEKVGNRPRRRKKRMAWASSQDGVDGEFPDVQEDWEQNEFPQEGGAATVSMPWREDEEEVVFETDKKSWDEEDDGSGEEEAEVQEETSEQEYEGSGEAMFDAANGFPETNLELSWPSLEEEFAAMHDQQQDVHGEDEEDEEEEGEEEEEEDELDEEDFVETGNLSDEQAWGVGSSVWYLETILEEPNEDMSLYDQSGNLSGAASELEDFSEEEEEEEPNQPRVASFSEDTREEHVESLMDGLSGIVYEVDSDDDEEHLAQDGSHDSDEILVVFQDESIPPPLDSTEATDDEDEPPDSTSVSIEMHKDEDLVESEQEENLHKEMEMHTDEQDEVVVEKEQTPQEENLVPLASEEMEQHDDNDDNVDEAIVESEQMPQEEETEEHENNVDEAIVESEQMPQEEDIPLPTGEEALEDEDDVIGKDDVMVEKEQTPQEEEDLPLPTNERIEVHDDGVVVILGSGELPFDETESSLSGTELRDLKLQDHASTKIRQQQAADVVTPTSTAGLSDSSSHSKSQIGGTKIGGDDLFTDINLDLEEEDEENLETQKRRLRALERAQIIEDTLVASERAPSKIFFYETRQSEHWGAHLLSRWESTLQNTLTVVPSLLTESEQAERLAILESETQGEFYLYLLLKLRSMIFACESLHRGGVTMNATGNDASMEDNGTLQEYSLSVLRRGVQGTIREIDYSRFAPSGAALASVLYSGSGVVEQVEAAPGGSSSAVGALCSLIRHDRDKIKGIARVVYFCALSKVLEGATTEGLSLVLERTVRLIVRARSAGIDPRQIYDPMSLKKTTGRFVMLLLDVERKIPPREAAQLGSTLLLKTMMHPHRHTELYKIMKLKTSANSRMRLPQEPVHELLACTTLDLTPEQIRCFPPFRSDEQSG